MDPIFVIRVTFGNDGNKALVANTWPLTSRSSLIYQRFWLASVAIIIFQGLS
jgi:hypothetical protein